MHDLDLKTLRLLVAVCEQNNIKQAANLMHIEPSAISKRIAQLEQALGTQILVRGRRGVQPTPAGQVLLEHARSILYTLERLEQDVAGFNAGIKGHVRLAASASAIAEDLLDDLALFMQAPEHRDIQVNIEEHLSVDLVRKVREGSLSIGICWDNVDFSGLETLPYRTDQLGLAVPSNHPLATWQQIAFKDTLDYEYVGLHLSTAVHTMLHREAAKLGRTLKYRVITSNFDSAFRVVAANLGVSIVPLQVATVYVQAQKLKVIPLQDAWAQRRFAICFRSLAGLTPAAGHLVKFLTACATQTAALEDA